MTAVVVDTLQAGKAASQATLVGWTEVVSMRAFLFEAEDVIVRMISFHIDIDATIIRRPKTSSVSLEINLTDRICRCVEVN